MKQKIHQIIIIWVLFASSCAQAALVIHFKMDDKSDLMRNHGSASITWTSQVGAKSLDTGKFNGAGYFDPSIVSYYTGQLGGAMVDLSAFSLSLHIRTVKEDQTTGKDFISIGTGNLTVFSLQKNHNHSVSLLNIGQVGGVSSEALVGDKKINDGEWHHLGVVSDGENVMFYIDGEQQGVTKYKGTGLVTSMQLASRFGNNSYAINTDIDDLAIYNKALSAGQMKSLSSNAATNEPVGEIESGVLLGLGKISVILR